MNNKAILYSSYEEEKQHHFQKKQTVHHVRERERENKERDETVSLARLVVSTSSSFSSFCVDT